MPPKGVSVKVFGDYACFSRPEFKVERVSYQVITPSAARGILKAIFWKPEFRYQVREIHVLKLGTQTTILRNEIASRQSLRPILIDDQRQQRTSLILKDVAYVIRAELVLSPHTKDEIGKYLDQFNRRVDKGQCHHTPCLGNREFSAFFEAPEKSDHGGIQNPDFSLDLGQMLFDCAYIEVADRKEGELEFWKTTEAGRKKVWGRALALFFNASVSKGTLTVPAEKYSELYRIEAGHA